MILVLPQNVGIHSIQIAGHHRQPELTTEEVLVCLDKTPEQSIPDVAPIPFAIIRHLAHIIRAGEIGLGGEQTSVSKLTHSIDIRNHYPVVGINKQLHEPAVDTVGMKAAKQHQIAQQHQTLDVMAIASV